MKLSYDDIKLGDIISYYLNGVGGMSGTKPTAWLHQGTIIAIKKDKNLAYYYIIGWKQDPLPQANSTCIAEVAPYGWTIFNLIEDFGQYTHYDTINYHAEIDGILRKGLPISHSVQEKPCVGCSAMNDVGVKICYRCGGLDPTQSGSVPASAIRRGYV